MKLMKKITALFICLSIAVLTIPIVSHAASAELRFSDPSTTLGATFEVTAKLTADESVDTVTAALTYDAASLRFISGEGAAGGNGQIELTGQGSGSTSELNWTMQFQAIAEGTASIQISSVTGTTSDGTSLQVTRGNSTVTIGPGDASLIDNTGTDTPGTSVGSGVNVEVNGQQYTISSEFSDVLVPEGFTKTELSYEGQTCQAAIQESSGMYALYLASAGGQEEFFLYNPEDGAFSPFEQINVSQDRFIILLQDDKSENLPSIFQKTTLTVNGKDFPAWQNVDEADYYVVYALNSDGKKGFYQYETTDGTYQRFVVTDKADEEETSPTSFLGKLVDLLRKNLDKFLIGAWAVFLIMLILLIVIAVKLRHRNEYLDELDEKYGIYDEEEEEEDEYDTPAPRNTKQPRVKEKGKEPKQKKKKADEDDFYDFEDEDEEFADLDDGYEEDTRASEYDDYADFGVYEEEELDDDLEDIDDIDELLDARVRESSRPKRPQPNRRGHEEEDDTFKVDFIDLD